MKPERIELSQTERDRLNVLHEFKQKHIRQVEAARRLALSDRQVRRLLRRVQAEGDCGVVHRLRGRPSNRKISEAVQERALRLLRKETYTGFGPTLAAVHLRQAGMPVSRETARNWMAAAGLWRPRRQRLRALHVWRPRRAAFGELVMMDSSEHAWLEQRGPKRMCTPKAIESNSVSRVVEAPTAWMTVPVIEFLKPWLYASDMPSQSLSWK